MERDRNPDSKGDNNRQGTGFVAVLKSVSAAAFGVQSSANRKRDFQHGKPLHFIIGGLIFTLVFILVIVQVVRWLIQAG